MYHCDPTSRRTLSRSLTNLNNPLPPKIITFRRMLHPGQERQVGSSCRRLRGWGILEQSEGAERDGARGGNLRALLLNICSSDQGGRIGRGRYPR